MEEKIKKLLQKSLAGRLGMCADGIPYVVPMNYGFDAEYIYCHSRAHGKKIDIITGNPNVCFEVDTCESIVSAELACNWTSQGESVIINGTAEFVKDNAEKKTAMDIIMKHYAPDETFQFVPVYFNAIKVIRIKIEEITYKEKTGN